MSSEAKGEQASYISANLKDIKNTFVEISGFIGLLLVGIFQ